MSLDLESYILGKKSGGGEEPTGTIDITTNGITNVKSYASANVNVQPDLESKTVTITENTTTLIEPTTGKDGLSSVSVTTNIPSSGDDWSDIGYSSTPQSIVDAHTYSKNIYDNWDSSRTNGYQAFRNSQMLICPKIDTSNITGSTGLMFNSCQSLLEIPKLIMTPSDCSQMFASCNQLTNIDVSGIDISNCTNIYSMFQYCTKLQSIDLSNFNTQNVTNAQELFSQDSKLTTITFGNNFKLDKVSSFYQMFATCSSLTSLDLSMFDCQPTRTDRMFYNCSNLTTITFGNNFDTSLVTNMGYMFYYVNNLDDNTLNQILKLCINATSMATKTLTNLGFSSGYYPVSRLQTLSNWQDFLDAGWTAGY